MKKFSDYYSLKQTATFLGVTSATILNWIAKGKMRHYAHPITGYKIFDKEDLEALLKSIKDQN